MGIDGTFEWVINNPKDIRPYAILVRDKEGADHRRLKELIMPMKPHPPRWNQVHKPLQFNSWKHVEGRLKDPKDPNRDDPGLMCQLKESFIKAQLQINKVTQAKAEDQVDNPNQIEEEEEDETSGCTVQ